MVEMARLSSTETNATPFIMGLKQEQGEDHKGHRLEIFCQLYKHFTLDSALMYRVHFLDPKSWNQGLSFRPEAYKAFFLSYILLPSANFPFHSLSRSSTPSLPFYRSLNIYFSFLYSFYH